MIQGIQIPTEGIIKLDGVDLRQIDLTHIRQNIGIVLQESFLFRGTIRQNIAATNPRASAEEIVAAARLAGAEEFIDQLPMAYDSLLEEGATNLSGGQRQRIAIARALLAKPRLLIFDEATSALDSEVEQAIQENLYTLMEGKTVIAVAHRLSTIAAMDRLVIMDKGAVVEDGTHRALLDKGGLYASLWQRQSGGFLIEDTDLEAAE
jgi:ATP-binding cassette subfamily B protein